MKEFLNELLKEFGFKKRTEKDKEIKIKVEARKSKMKEDDEIIRKIIEEEINSKIIPIKCEIERLTTDNREGTQIGEARSTYYEREQKIKELKLSIPEIRENIKNEYKKNKYNLYDLRKNPQIFFETKKGNHFEDKLEKKHGTASSYIPISPEAKIMIESGLKALEILESSIDLPEESLIEVSKDFEGNLKGNQPNELPSRIFVESIIDSNGKEFPNPIQLSFQKTESMIIYIARNTIDESKIFETEIESPGFRAEKVVGVGKKDKKKQDEVFIYDSLHKLYSMYDNYMNKNNIIFRDTVYIIKIKNPIPYPAEKENRRTTFGNPLSSIFGLKFDEIAIEYFKDGENRLYDIAVACFKSKVKYKNEDEMPELNARLFKLYSAYVSEFFKGINIEAEIANVCLPSNSKISLVDYAIESMNSQKENAGKEVIEKKEFKPAIIKLETGKLDLITNRGTLNVDDFIFDERTSIQMTEDGRFLVGFISKKDGNRYYTEVPEEQGRKWWNETK